MTDGPHTTITVAEYNRLANVIGTLRKRLQKVRELLEKKDIDGALAIAKCEDDQL